MPRMLARLGAPAPRRRAPRATPRLWNAGSARSPPRRRLFFRRRHARRVARRRGRRRARALRELFAALAFVRRDVANVAVASLVPLARRDERASPRIGGPGTGSRQRRGVEAVAERAGGGDATRLAAALPRTSAWLAAATRAAHALDASSPSLAFETRDVAFRVPPNATSATSAGATNPRRFAFAMRSGNAFGSARGKDARSGAFRIASSSPRDPAQVSVRATRATSHEGLVRVALVNLVTSSDKSVEAPDGGGSAETPEARARTPRASATRAAPSTRSASAPRASSSRPARRATRGAPHAERTRAPRAPGRLARRPDDIRGDPAPGGGRPATRAPRAAAATRRPPAPRIPQARGRRALAEALCVRALSAAGRGGVDGGGRAGRRPRPAPRRLRGPEARRWRASRRSPPASTSPSGASVGRPRARVRHSRRPRARGEG